MSNKWVIFHGGSFDHGRVVPLNDKVSLKYVSENKGGIGGPTIYNTEDVFDSEVEANQELVNRLSKTLAENHRKLSDLTGEKP